jgi:hypothetical protein
MKKDKIVRGFVIGTFVTLYLMVSIISTIHVIDFFELSNPYWLAVTLAIAFEVGAAASLASLVILDKMNRGLVWTLFSAITLMQMQGNMYYAFTNLQDFTSWSELFGLIEEEVIFQKRVIAAVSGAILPLVALGFIKSLVDYIKPESNDEKAEEKEEILGSEEYLFNLQKNEVKEEPKKESFEDYLVDIPLKYAESYSEPFEKEEAQSIEENVEDMRKVVEAYDDLEEEIKEWEEASLTDFHEDIEWDESHALDQVLNDIAEEVEEIEVTEEPEVVVSEENDFSESIQEEENENAEEKKS